MAGTVRKWNFDLRSVLTIIILCLAGCSTLFGQNSGTGTAASVRAGRKPVDMQGIDAYSIKYQDTTALCLVGGVMFYHNGTIITCDSAVRYSERRMECFRNVIINKDSLYVYGDRAEYNGETNMAYIYSPLIKVVDGDATMYTYNFSYNTLDNVGKFSGGAIVTKGDNRLESQRGYYYADSSEVICVEDVSMRDSTYQLQSDSVIYNLETDVARFFDHTYIWNENDEMLYADAGSYDRPADRFETFANSYVLTASQEVWADTIDYRRGTRNAILRRNIQIDDIDHKAMAFGDYGEYWGDREEALLTMRPSVMSYDPEQGDTLYVRADSILMFTPSLSADSAAMTPDSAVMGADSAAMAVDSTMIMPSDSLLMPGGMNVLPSDSAAVHPAPMVMGTDGALPDSTVVRPSIKPFGTDRQPSDGEAAPGTGETTESPVAGAVSASADAGSGGDAVDNEPPGDSEGTAVTADAESDIESGDAASDSTRADENPEKQDKPNKKAKDKSGDVSATDESLLEPRESRREIKRREREERRRQRRAEKMNRYLESVGMAPDTVSQVDSTSVADSTATDMFAQQLDSAMVQTPADSTAGDSVRRVVRAYRNVKSFRNDFQTVCDSLVMLSADSTIHLYINPVLWNDQNQIQSELIDIYTANQQITRAVFVGNPIMAEMIDTSAYNQVSGKEIEALFRDNEIYQVNAVGNGQTLYYTVDENSGTVTEFMTIACADITFHITDRKVDLITWRGNPVYDIYAIEQVPETEEQRLKGFAWYGDRRPTLEDVFDRTVVPSRREEMSRMPHPEFPIMRRIDKHRERLSASGLWRDRTETLSPDAVEFIRAIRNASAVRR